jgi:rRNA-processing protein FCF1
MAPKAKRTAPPSYVDALLAELRGIETEFVAIVEDSEIYHFDPNAGGGGVFFVGASTEHWQSSSSELTGRRMRLLSRLRDWVPRFQLLYPHPTPEVAKTLSARTAHLENWLLREGSDGSIPRTVEQAIARVHQDVGALRQLTEMLPSDEWPIRVVIDTNALIDNPDVAAYNSTFSSGYLVHLIPVVLRELDELKRSGRTPELREQAARANRRLKGIRSNATTADTIRVAGNVHLRFDHVEPRGDALPAWLDLTVPDDRLVASTLLLQSEHSGSQVHVVTSDVNLQTKLSAMGLPFLDPDAEITKP